jgi:hypothetical protein
MVGGDEGLGQQREEQTTPDRAGQLPDLLRDWTGLRPRKPAPGTDDTIKSLSDTEDTEDTELHQ